MTNSNAAHITLILDRSGSMGSIKEGAIAAVNGFITEQQAVPGDCSFTLVQFDSEGPYDVVQDVLDIHQAAPLTDETYKPRGNTPLMDAIGNGIIKLGNKLSAMAESQRPARVVFVIQTDGLENASVLYTREKIRHMIEHQQSVYGWVFIFMGANHDAILAAQEIGIAKADTMQYLNSVRGTVTMGNMVANKVANYRATGQNLAYTDEERAQAMAE